MKPGWKLTEHLCTSRKTWCPYRWYNSTYSLVKMWLSTEERLTASYTYFRTLCETAFNVWKIYYNERQCDSRLMLISLSGVQIAIIFYNKGYLQIQWWVCLIAGRGRRSLRQEVVLLLLGWFCHIWDYSQLYFDLTVILVNSSLMIVMNDCAVWWELKNKLV